MVEFLLQNNFSNIIFLTILGFQKCQHFFLVDIPLLPSITSLSLGENEEKSGPFVVHWLNNKELHFTLSIEVFLQQLKKSFEHHSAETNTEESNQMRDRKEGKSLITEKWLPFYKVIYNVLCEVRSEQLDV